MKIKKLIKALYYLNPESMGYIPDDRFTIQEIYQYAVKPCELDNCSNIAVAPGFSLYVGMYIDTIKDSVESWYIDHR